MGNWQVTVQGGWEVGMMDGNAKVMVRKHKINGEVSMAKGAIDWPNDE